MRRIIALVLQILLIYIQNGRSGAHSQAIVSGVPPAFTEAEERLATSFLTFEPSNFQRLEHLVRGF